MRFVLVLVATVLCSFCLADVSEAGQHKHVHRHKKHEKKHRNGASTVRESSSCTIRH